MMEQYGVNFIQTIGDGFVKGSLSSGLSLSSERDNRIVPFVSMKGGHLVRVN
jgi:hypothetical protein